MKTQTINSLFPAIVLSFLVCSLIPAYGNAFGTIGAQKLTTDSEDRRNNAREILASMTPQDFTQKMNYKGDYVNLVRNKRNFLYIPCKNKADQFNRIEVENNVLQCIIWDDGSFDIRVTRHNQDALDVGTIFTHKELSFNFKYRMDDAEHIDKITLRRGPKQGIIVERTPL